MNSLLLSKVSGVIHNFGDFKTPINTQLFKNWELYKPIWKQVHDVKIVEVIGPNQQCGETDGLLTLTKNQPIAVVTADCVPILLARRDGQAVAALHAGWRGTQARIVQSFVRLLKSKNDSLREWYAAIGPAIRACCYEVSQELALDFKNTFPQHPPSFWLKGSRHIDLQKINELELKALGIQNVEIIEQCTFCQKNADGSPTFHSYRREKNKSRQLSIISIV